MFIYERKLCISLYFMFFREMKSANNNLACVFLFTRFQKCNYFLFINLPVKYIHIPNILMSFFKKYILKFKRDIIYILSLLLLCKYTKCKRGKQFCPNITCQINNELLTETNIAVIVCLKNF